MNFFVWGTLKKKVYSVSINSRKQLRDRIVLHQISQEQCLVAIKAIGVMLVLLQKASILNRIFII